MRSRDHAYRNVKHCFERLPEHGWRTRITKVEEDGPFINNWIRDFFATREEAEKELHDVIDRALGAQDAKG